MVLDQRYRLERHLGEGASSIVFAATDTRLDRQVAIKVLRTDAGPRADARRARFAAEAKTLAQLSHGHIVAIHDAAQTSDGIAFLVMELAVQGTLETELRARGQLAAAEFLPLILPVLGALAHAHDCGIVHRDLKPANLVLTGAPGRDWRAKVLDFGIAARRDAEADSGLVAGTPAYMAPEQIVGGQIGPHTDVWAMGAVLFRALSGRLPFEGASRAELLSTIVHARAPSLLIVSPQVRPHLALAIERALEPEPKLRYRDMRELARALAIACRLDGVSLPLAPDPLGLPRFAEWLAEADLQTTADLAAGSPLGQPAVTPRASAENAAPVSSRRGQVRQIGAAMLAIGAGLWALTALGAARMPAQVRDQARVDRDVSPNPFQLDMSIGVEQIDAPSGGGARSSTLDTAGDEHAATLTGSSTATALDAAAGNTLARPASRSAGSSRQRPRSLVPATRDIDAGVDAIAVDGLPPARPFEPGRVVTQWDW